MNYNALIGYTGFVGSTLLKQTDFHNLYRSTNIESIEGKEFDTIVCAGAPAKKWLANKEPEADRYSIEKLMNSLAKVKCKRFVLISTIDVFKSPIGVDEYTAVDENNLHPYGLHRRELEKFVEANFENSIIIRLPGLVGPGLKKNIIFDFLNNNNLSMVDSRGEFQFYPMVNLWSDINCAIESGKRIIHFTVEPIKVETIASEAFGIDFINECQENPARYDVRTRFSEILEGKGDYHYSAKESLTVIRSYRQSEPLDEDCK
ncbi:pyridine nucleotide transhydrogenase [Photobacterium sp. OFAV2-7]|uniref:pyridine nucleotide transhydrogenase n=1 Tax=Photobacterium sp. OFAV2-7 TaxID=2917748 RepID=UPI001EF726D1|nr:pyridine nucleotide transhydrogenase [Photobacterium sp. OFAV2-7]MCG7588654.1 pyridine nucleotide transhydrogenase [Photobacterium sp. OFAV2-7]